MCADFIHHFERHYPRGEKKTQLFVLSFAADCASFVAFFPVNARVGGAQRQIRTHPLDNELAYNAGLGAPLRPTPAPIAFNII